jgi:hypothetical protein
MAHRELYSDGIGRITVTGGVVRVDLESLSPSQCDANNNPKSTFRQRVIFSLDGFVKSLEVMQKAFQGLVDGGVIERKAINGVAEPPPRAAAETPPQVTKDILQ